MVATGIHACRARGNARRGRLGPISPGVFRPAGDPANCPATNGGPPIGTGTFDYRDLFCRALVTSHIRYDPARIDWPDLHGDDWQMLAQLPVWDEAVNTEHYAAVVVRAMADHEPDQVLAEAIGMQALEEERHCLLVGELTKHYGFGVARRETPRPAHPEWAFYQCGWGECMDAFFAFGVFAVASRLQAVPQGLLRLFDLVLQEEARHILFFENWRRYRRDSAPTPAASARCRASDALAASLVVAGRLRSASSAVLARSGAEDNFLFSGAKALGGLSAGSFLDICLAENSRRLATFDARLARPTAVPRAAQTLRRLLPEHRVPGPSS